MKIAKTIFLDERDIRQALADYVGSANAGEVPLIKPEDIEFKLKGKGEISAKAKAT